MTDDEFLNDRDCTSKGGTPRTDAAARVICGHAIVPQWIAIGGAQEVVSAEFARTLELELARALRDRDNALELAAQACVDEVNRNMDEYTRLPENVTRRVIYAAMGVAASNCRDSIREIIDARHKPEAGR